MGRRRVVGSGGRLHGRDALGWRRSGCGLGRARRSSWCSWAAAGSGVRPWWAPASASVSRWLAAVRRGAVASWPPWSGVPVPLGRVTVRVADDRGRPGRSWVRRRRARGARRGRPGDGRQHGDLQSAGPLVGRRRPRPAPRGRLVALLVGRSVVPSRRSAAGWARRGRRSGAGEQPRHQRGEAASQGPGRRRPGRTGAGAVGTRREGRDAHAAPPHDAMTERT